MIFLSNFANDISEFINEKILLGYSYTSPTKILKRFDLFCNYNYPNELILKASFFQDYFETIKNKTVATLRTHIYSISEFYRFMNRKYNNNIPIPEFKLPKKIKYVPYIFSDEELVRFFNVTDQMIPVKSNFNNKNHIIYPLFFRLLCSTGIRLSESTSLKLNNIDFDTGVLTIIKGKFSKDRKLPISESLLNRFKEYLNIVHPNSQTNNFCFIGQNGLPLCHSNIRRIFHEIRWKAGIPSFVNSFNENSGGPRVHSFRHTFAVHCLKKWIERDKDLNAYIPILQAYLGHVSLRDTAYYLHLTIHNFPDIISKTQAFVGDIVPILSTNNE
jgi:integrase